MRWVVLIAVVAIVLMFLGGWLYFEDSGDKSEIILDKQEVRQDTQAAMDTGKEAIKETAEGMKRLGESAEDAVTGDETANEQAAQPNSEAADSQ